MMKKLIVAGLMMAALAVPCYASDNSQIELKGTADDGTDQLMSTGLLVKRFPSGTIQQQYISLDGNTTTILTVPTGAKAVLIDMISTDGVQLKGASGDVGISLDSTTPVLLPISSDSTIVIDSLEANGNRIRVYWL